MYDLEMTFERHARFSDLCDPIMLIATESASGTESTLNTYSDRWGFPGILIFVNQKSAFNMTI